MARSYRNSPLKNIFNTYRQGIIVAAVCASLGAMYIFSSSASVALPADINDDGVVNITDLSILLSNWGKTANPNPNPTPNPQPGEQRLGVGGVATPPGAILSTADTTADLDISTSGTAGSPRVYDCKGHTIGSVKIRANYVVVQNCRIDATGQYGVDAKGSNFVTVQNNDIKGVQISGDGDLNAITFYGNNHKYLYNTAINFVEVENAGGSHTDAIQTWNDDPGEESNNILIKGNRFEGPPSEGPADHIHQGVICEGKDSTDGGGGGDKESRNWLIDGNYFTADLKFDDCDDVHVTRNTFAGNDKRAVVVTSLSTGFKYYSDNIVTGTLSVGIGATVTPGAGPTTLPGL